MGKALSILLKSAKLFAFDKCNSANNELDKLFFFANKIPSSAKPKASL